VRADIDKTVTAPVAPAMALARPAAPPTRARALTAASLRSLRRSWPVALVGMALIALWYAVGLYDDIPAASQLLGNGASSGQVWNAALDLHNPWVPLPHQVLADFFGALAQAPDAPASLWLHLGTTGMEALLGLIAGTVLGVLIATVFVLSRLAERTFLPYVVASQTVPVIALAPIIISVFGISLTSKVIISTYLTFFAVAVSTTKGFKSTAPLAHELMRSYAANPWQVYWKLRFPTALPYLFTGLKVAATASLVGAIIAELPFGSATGLGARLLQATTYDATVAIWSTILAAAMLGMTAYGAIALLERLIVRRPVTGVGGPE